MAGMTVKLQGLMAALPPAERRVVAVLLKNPRDVLLQSVYACAAAAGVSAASVGRVARKAGCRDFKELKIELAREADAPVSFVYGAITGRDSDEQVVQKIFGANIQSLEGTLKLLDVSRLGEVAKWICRLRHVIFIGIGSSGNIARESALRFAHLGLATENYSEPYEITVRTPMVPRSAVVVGISHSGHSAATLHGLEAAGRKGAVTVGISNYPRSPLEKVSRYFFCTAFRENKVGTAAISSKLSQLGLLDALYGLVARHLSGRADPAVLNELVERQFRVKTKKRS